MGVERATSTNRGKFIYYVVYIEYPLAVHTPSPDVVFVCMFKMIAVLGDGTARTQRVHVALLATARRTSAICNF